MTLTSKIVTLCFPAKCLGCCDEISPFGSHFESPFGSENAGPENDNRQMVEFAADQTDSLSSDVIPLDGRSSHFDFATAFDVHWCRDCWRQLTANATKQCRKCGANLYHDNRIKDGCPLCHGIDLRFDRALAIGNYRGLLQELVIRMKNQHDEQISIQLANLLAFELINVDFLPEINLVVPVPTHWWRRMRRGFQAAEVVAETVAAACNIPYAGQILRCLRGTKKQGTLSTAGRFKNVRGAFDVRPSVRVDGLNVLLVDDVMTSGATASEIARILKVRGAAKVYVGVIARGARVS